MRKNIVTTCVAVSCTAITLFGVRSSLAAEPERTDFPNIGETNDLSLESAWGGADGMPTAAKPAGLTSTLGTYHASKDVDLYGLYVYRYKTPTTNVIDQTDYPDVTIGAEGGVLLRQPHAHLSLIGGTWDMKGTGTLASFGGDYAVGNPGFLTLDGVKVTNAANMRGASYTDGARFIVTNGADVTTTSFKMFDSNAMNCFYGQYDSTVAFDGKTSADRFDLTARYGYGNTAVFDGSATVFTNKTPTLASAYVYSGTDKVHDNRMEVRRGAKVFLGCGTYFATGADAYDNRLSVSGAGSYLGTTEMNVGNTASPCEEGHENVLEVADGATLSAGRRVIMYSRSDAIVSNATLSAQYVYLGWTDNDHHCRFFVRGESPVFSVTGFNFFYKGYGHLWEFDGATFLHPELGTTWSAAAVGLSSNVVRVVNGSHVSFAYMRVPLWNKSTTLTSGNEIYVGADSKLELGNLWLMNKDNRVVVSNGTLAVNKEGTTNLNLILGYADADTVSTNCTLVLQGTKPKVTAGYSLYLYNHSILRLELPTSGLRLTEPIVDAYYMSCDTTGNRLEVTGWSDYQKSLSESVDIPVMSTDLGIGAAFNASIEAANEELAAAGARKIYFYKSSDNMKLFLHVHHPPRGLSIIVH